MFSTSKPKSLSSSTKSLNFKYIFCYTSITGRIYPATSGVFLQLCSFTLLLLHELPWNELVKCLSHYLGKTPSQMSGPICRDLEERCWIQMALKRLTTKLRTQGTPVRQLRCGRDGTGKTGASLRVSLSTLTLTPVIQLSQSASPPEPISLSLRALDTHQNTVQNGTKLSTAKLNPHQITGQTMLLPGRSLDLDFNFAASGSPYFEQMR